MQKKLLFSTIKAFCSLHRKYLLQNGSLRFQIEFNFRDAKQFWGLEDFMNIKERQLTNACGTSYPDGQNAHFSNRDFITSYGVFPS